MVDPYNENYKGKLHVFTDGSKDIDKHMAGDAFVVPSSDLKVGIKCNPNLSVFTTELIAIEYAITWICKNKIKDSVILSDSLSTIQVLQAGRSKTRPDKINNILGMLDRAKTKGYVISYRMDTITCRNPRQCNSRHYCKRCNADWYRG